MKRNVVLAALAVAIVWGPDSGAAQAALPDSAARALVEERFARLAESVVRIRTTAHMEFPATDPTSGLMVQMASPISMHGTGIVIGSFEEDGEREYLILSNDHVVNVSDYFIRQGNFLRRKEPGAPGTRTRSEESFVVLPGEGSAPGSVIQLKVLARSPLGDMALVRTVGAGGALSVAPFRIGFETGEVDVGEEVLTSGYPWGRDQVIAKGTVLATDEVHQLGGAHRDFRLDIALEPGQSGSPVFTVRIDESGAEPEVHFSLIGLLHAREAGQRFMVPFQLWGNTLRDALAALPFSIDRR